MAVGYVAVAPLKWGDDTIQPGDPVPADEPGRDYPGMLHLGLIREADSTAGASDSELRKRLKAAEARVAELEAQAASGGTAQEGPRLVLTDEQAAMLVERGLTGEFSLEQLDAALTADDGAGGAEAGGAPAAETADSTGGSDDDLPDGVTDLGGGWYLLADGETKVHGRKALDEALAAQQ